LQVFRGFFFAWPGFPPHWAGGVKGPNRGGRGKGQGGALVSVGTKEKNSLWGFRKKNPTSFPAGNQNQNTLGFWSPPGGPPKFGAGGGKTGAGANKTVLKGGGKRHRVQLGEFKGGGFLPGPTGPPTISAPGGVDAIRGHNRGKGSNSGGGGGGEPSFFFSGGIKFLLVREVLTIKNFPPTWPRV